MREFTVSGFKCRTTLDVEIKFTPLRQFGRTQKRGVDYFVDPYFDFTINDDPPLVQHSTGGISVFNKL